MSVLIPNENIFPFFGFVSCKSFLSTCSNDNVYEVNPTVITDLRKSLYWYIAIHYPCMCLKKLIVIAWLLQ